MSIGYSNLIKTLQTQSVDFVVIGGVAAALHGSTLHTQDVDICCDFAPANLFKLQKALSEFHPVHRMTPKRIPLELKEETCKGLKNLYLDTDLGQLDCLSFVEGIGNFEDVMKNSQCMKTYNGIVRVLSIEALIKSKKSLNREHDRQAIHQLETILKMQKDNP